MKTTFRTLLSFLLVCFLSIDLSFTQHDTVALIRDLGCGACHDGVPISEGMFEKAPSLSYAGLRYNPGYVFEYLDNPRQVRKHIGSARMPDFFLDERERLAVSLFLGRLKSVDRPLPSFPTKLQRVLPGGKSVAGEKIIADELKCTDCHKLDGEGADLAVELNSAAARLNPDWLLRYLALPQAYEPHSSMPAQVYSLSSSGRNLVETIPGAAEKIREMVRYFVEIAMKERQRLDDQFERAKRKHKDITPELGGRIVAALNCSGCHTVANMEPWKNGPQLAVEGSRVRAEWLQSYLQKPSAVRAFGFFPGSGSRMPDFRLSAEEAQSLTDVLLRMPQHTYKDVTPVRLSPFAKLKTEKLLRDRLPCLGCHQLDGEGGMIGPDLSSSAKRLRPEFLAALIRDPQHVVLNSIMPRTSMTQELTDLVTSYVISTQRESRDYPYLSLTDHPIVLPSEQKDEKDLYARFCSPCHGITGNGDGFNARYLSAKPAPHSSKSYMSSRADDTIYDGIFNGSRILGKTNRMPAYGETLTSDQIWSLTRYIRQLCKCDGPSWSTSQFKDKN